MTGEAPIALSRVPLLQHRYFTLFLLWLVLTALNLNKAFHIDDTFHLEAAKWIGEHPLTPMSGFINWDNLPEPLYNFNQPPLFFYLLAGVTRLMGTGEVALHLFLSLFTFLALWFFQKITKQLELKNKNTLLFFFALNPAFLVNQNLMTDVPILSLTLGTVYFILRAANENPTRNYSMAATFLGAGLLIKYSLLPLLVVLFIFLIIRRHYKFLWVLIIPCGLLFLWSFWNLNEYGAVHVLGRPREGFKLKHLWDFINCLGAISFFSIPFVYGLHPSKWLKWLITGCALFFILSIICVALDFIPIKEYNFFLNYGFTANGLLIFVALLVFLFKQYKKTNVNDLVNSGRALILITLLAFSSFMIFLAPFMATRHLLLVIPFVLILGNDLLERTTGFIRNLSFAATAVLGFLLGISDWTYANYYRQAVSEIKLPATSTTWYAGHWGWQWYAEKRGWKQYNINRTDLKDGDYLVYPGNISIQSVNKSNMYLMDKKWKQASPLNFFSVGFASLYSSGIDRAPWELSKAPVDTVYVYKIGNNP